MLCNNYFHLNCISVHVWSDTIMLSVLFIYAIMVDLNQIWSWSVQDFEDISSFTSAVVFS